MLKFRFWRVSTKLIGLVVFSAIIFFAFFLLSQKLSFSDLGLNLFTEIIGISITVFIIGGLRMIISEEELKQSLVRRSGSTSNETAKASIDELRKIGWLSRGILRGADLSEADLKKANLRGVDLTGADLTKADMQEAQLLEAILTEAILDATNFTSADLTEVTFQQNTKKHWLTGFTRTRTPLHAQRAIYENATLERVDFSNVGSLRQINFQGATLDGCIFKNCDLQGVVFREASVQDATFENVKMDGANLKGADFSRSKFKKVSLKKSSFGHCIFHETKLHDVDLTGCQLDEGQELADFSEATFDRSTKLPDGKNWNYQDESYLNDLGIGRKVVSELVEPEQSKNPFR